MPELALKERLQPSLLDRLTDDAPRSRVESHEKRVLTAAQLQESVVRDLSWLLNTVNLACCQDLTNFPLLQQSVINYGVPALSGALASGLDPHLLAQQIAAAIRSFEPRLLPDSIRVSTQLAEHDMSVNAVRFLIEAILWSQPLPIELFLRAEVDLDTGDFKVTDQSR
ncbi:MAG: type VI secretion system baseplate subunit TssE [Pirellulaceae bacterium]|jgi:type VI secretion system protein ImpF|nr:type VI secretion system baseplate subunit TssE [Pirellulaceae bacterium]